MTPLPVNHAKHAARQWTEQQEDLPDGWYILARRYDQERQGRYFDVQLSIKSSGHNSSREYGLITFLVKDDRSVEVMTDRRVYIRTLLEDSDAEIVRPVRRSAPKYTQEEAEIHLLKVLEMSKGILSKWYIGMRQATEKDKREQIDLWCDLENRFGEKTTVPIKVFVSRADKSNFYNSLPASTTRHYACIMVRPSHQDAFLVQEVIRRLNHLRKSNLC